MIPNHLENPILITNRINQRWLHHLPMAQGAIYLSKQKKIFFSWGRVAPESLPNGLEVKSIASEELGYTVTELIRENHEKKLILEGDVPYYVYHALEENGIRSVAIRDGVIEHFRETKDDWEIAQLAEASRITDLAFSKILGDLKPGVTELEVAAKLEYYMRLEGCEEFNKTIVASGVNSAKPHHWPTKKPLEKGDFVTMDYGCTVNGYHSDLTRTVVLGRANEKQKAIYETVLKAQQTATRALAAGKISGAMDQLARDVIDGTEFRGSFLHNLGHGIGLDIHEGIGLVQGSEAVLKQGMVVSIEPGIYLQGFGGVRIEDIAVVEQDGCRVLEHSDHALIEL